MLNSFANVNNRLPCRVILLALLFAASHALICSRGAEKSSSSEGPRQPEPYLRITRSNSNVVQLQVAVRKFVPARRSGPAIWLTGASHIGDSNYFAALQKHLDEQALVLFEGISDFHHKGESARPAAIDSEPHGAGETNAAAEESSLQLSLARSLGLDFQLQAIDYRRPHFRNSDLSMQQLQRLMADSQSGGGKTSEQFQRLMQIMDESTFLGGLAKVVVSVLGSSPKLQAITRLALIETIGQIKGDISQMKGLPPEMTGLLKVLIQSRNQAVVDDLKAELKGKNRPRTISVLYGAGHMDDLEQRLRAQLKYRPVEQFWLTAFSVDLGKAGVTEAEVAMIRSLVKWQMEQLQP